MGNYIRLFADTDGGAVSSAAIDYLRALIRIAPVRLVSMSGPLAPPWAMFERLLQTSMDGTMVANVVCTDPSKWVRTIKVPMPKENPLHAALASGEIAELDEGVEVAARTMELHTEGTRNVLLCPVAPRAEPEILAVTKYDVVIVPTSTQPQTAQAALARTCVPVYAIKVPVANHVAFKNFVLGKST